MNRPALFLLSALTAACGSVPTTHYYVLAPPRAEAVGSSTEAGGARLGVETFAVDPPYDQNRLVYRVGRDSPEVGFYNHHRWSAPPGRLVATALAAGLEGTPGLDDVEPARVTGSYTHLLAGRVVALEEIDLPGGGLQRPLGGRGGGLQVARIQIDLKLLEPDSGAVIWERFVTAEEEGRAEDAADVIRQLRAAFAEVVRTVRAELETVFR